MNSVEQRLQQAADETRQVANGHRPKRLESETRERHQGWLVLVAAFALVVVTFGLVPWLAGIGDQPPVGDSTPAPDPVATSTTVTDTTMGTAAETACPQILLPGPIEGLPAAVAKTRDAIITAAATCDMEALQSLAGDQFTTSYGWGGSENLVIWNDKGLEPTRTLLLLLDMGHATIAGEDGEIYVWPAALTHESWDETTEEERDELARIHTEGEFDLFAHGGAYLGWRTGIDENGNWLYFVAGD